MKLNQKLLLTTLVSTACLLGGAKASADNYHFDISTGVLSGMGSGFPYELDVTLLSGGTFTNTVTLSNFTFNGGNPFGTPTVTGNATGDFSSSVTLTSGANLVNDLYQPFTDGTPEIGFDLTTTNVTGGSPDTFSVSILDFTGAPIYTTDPNGTMADLEIHTGALADPSIVSTYASVDPSPEGVTATVVPEPSSGIALVSGIGMLLGVRRRHRA